MGVELDEVWPFEQPGGMGRRRAVGPYHHGSYRPEVSARNVECIPGSSGCTRGGVIVALLILESVRASGVPRKCGPRASEWTASVRKIASFSASRISLSS